MNTDVVKSEGSGLRADARRNRDRILNTAVHHFAAHGIGASLEEIARDAGVGDGTLYRHFPSREALLASALRDRQEELIARAAEAREIKDSAAALDAWMAALQDYLRTFNGLTGPVLAAIKEQTSPLALSCERLVSITGEFLIRAQHQGRARAAVTANELFLGALGIAGVLGRADACGTTREALNEIFAHGYLGNDRDRATDEEV